MQFNSKRTQNIHVDVSKEFTKKIKHVDTTYTNRLISNIKVNVPDNVNYRLDRFDVDIYSLEKPLCCNISYNKKPKMIHINVPEYQEYKYNITPFNDYIPFVGNDTKRPYGEMYYRNKTLTSVNDFPKIDIDLDNKINMKK